MNSEQQKSASSVRRPGTTSGTALNCIQLGDLPQTLLTSKALGGNIQGESVRNSPDIRLLAVTLGVRCSEEIDDTTDKMWRAYDLCTLKWGLDKCWIGMGTHLNSCYFIYQYDTLTELVVKVRDKLQPEIGTFEVAASWFADLKFRLKDVYLASANTGSIHVQEGGWYRWLQDCHDQSKCTHPRYKPYQWTAIKHLRDILNLELQEWNVPGGRINVWPALNRYCAHI